MLPFSSQIKVPKVQTMHDPLYPSYLPIFNEYRDITDNYFVSISQAQRENAPNINYIGNVYNGVPVESYEFGDQPENRLIFLGRIKQIKGVKDAVDVATLTQTPLLIAGRTAMTEKAFIETEITPNVDGQLISQIGVIGHPEKVDYLKKSKALLFPVHWDEPFGLVMIEAMACGTPVIAYNRGSVAEVIKDGVTGFIVNEKDTDQTDNNNTDKTDKKEWIIKKTGIEGLAEAISRIGEIDRKACRKHVEENFSIGKMIDGYEEVYRKILDGRR
jgi:glycosyltransferase involved in cell wall biosynthesis